MKPRQNATKMRRNLVETRLRQVYSPISENIFALFLGKTVLVEAAGMNIQGRFRGIERLGGGKSHRLSVIILSEGRRIVLVRAWQAIVLLE